MKCFSSCLDYNGLTLRQHELICDAMTIMGALGFNVMYQGLFKLLLNASLVSGMSSHCYKVVQKI
ncbi:hypothetical protein [Legionella rowbothamii]|uniref:hypothetical protein n=1 Tax=Legionella rowbothamii TaxID=96229 RepID=UPI001055515E|nr:hypothetical protein [Legionella rowbothamii]